VDNRLDNLRIVRRGIVMAAALAMLLLMPSAAFAAYAPWVAQKSGTTQSLRGVAFATGNLGCAVGGGGTILRTTNGGSTWSAVKSGTTQQLNGVAFAGASNGWAVGNGGVILHTSNGGATWTAQKSGTTQPLNGIAFADTENGWAVGGGGVVLHTASGGSAWAAQKSTTTQPLYAVACADASTCWAVGNRAAVQHTADGGKTWSAQNAGLWKNTTLRTVGCSDVSVAWIAGSRSTVRKTTNGGSTWASQSAGASQVNGIVVADASHVRLVGNSGLVRATSNGGSAWTTETTPTTQTLYGVAGAGAAHAWAVGGAGTILAYSPDLTAPTTAATGLQADDHSGWTNAPVTVTLTAVDAGRAGVDHTYYTVDGGGRLTYAVPFAISSQGSHHIAYWSVDLAGNLESTREGYVNIDLTKPTVIVSGGVDDAWHAADVTVQLTADDLGGSGLAGTEYRSYGTTAWQPTAAGDTFTVDASEVGDGPHVYEFCAVDGAGNVSGVGSCTVKIDVTPPTTTATGLGDEYSGWTDTATPVSLSADDGAAGACSGVDSIHYAVNGGTPQAYSAPFVISDPGINEVTYWSVDEAGNQEQVRHGYVNIAVFYAKAEGLASDKVSEWHNGPATVTVTAGGTPASTLCYRVDGPGWMLDQASPATLHFSTAGNHSVEFYAKNPGGQSTPQTGYVNIDLTKPVTKLATPAPTRWVHSAVKLTCVASDDLAGIEATYSSVNGAPQVAGATLVLPAPLTRAGDGRFVVQYWSVDKAGNAEAYKYATVKIDTVRPTVSARYPASVVRYGTAKLRFTVKDKTLYRYGVKAAARIVIRNSHNRVVKTIKKSVKTGVGSTASFRCKLARGTYKFSVYATDPAGNKQVKVVSNRLTVR
jgi:photosystem II stability/assembly factor-like uncharacterized protein